MIKLIIKKLQYFCNIVFMVLYFQIILDYNIYKTLKKRSLKPELVERWI